MGGSTIKSLCAHPGMAATAIFANNAPTEHVAMANQYLGTIGQSDADGAMPLLTCVASPTALSGDFYAPDGSKELALGTGTQMKGPTEKVIPTEWQKVLMAQGAAVWAGTYKG